MKRHPVMSAEELVAYLKRTSLLTVLVEGTADAYVYRWVEERLKADGDVLVCNGRDTLLEVFRRRNEFANSKAVFVADQDMWYFSAIPSEYSGDVIFTDGYSIENDLFVRSVMEKLLGPEEKVAFELLIEQLVKWFAFEVDKHLKTGRSDCAVHINRVCPGSVLCEDYKKSVKFCDAPEELIARLKAEYDRGLRGKSLFEALVRFLSHPNRVSKFSKFNLMEIGAKMENEKIVALASRIDIRLLAYGGN